MSLSNKNYKNFHETFLYKQSNKLIKKTQKRFKNIGIWNSGKNIDKIENQKTVGLNIV